MMTVLAAKSGMSVTVSNVFVMTASFQVGNDVGIVRGAEGLTRWI